jgi:hypothetical protein
MSDWQTQKKSLWFVCKLVAFIASPRLTVMQESLQVVLLDYDTSQMATDRKSCLAPK